ncbi:MAG: WhiB family transcriptional regulator [Candidatus Saccharimonadales bacterium]
MSNEAYISSSEEIYLFEYSPDIVIDKLPCLDLLKKQMDIVNIYLIHYETYNTSIMASMLGISRTDFVTTLADINSCIKLVMELTEQASPKNIRPPISSRNQPKVKPEIDYLTQMENIRNQNNQTQEPAMKNTQVEGMCMGISDTELDSFTSTVDAVQRKAVKTYCIKCALMEACAENAVEKSYQDMVYGGYTSKALGILIKNRRTTVSINAILE